VRYNERPSTPYEEYDDIKLCPWCLNTMQHEEWYEDGYYPCENWYCECASAKKYLELQTAVDVSTEKLEKHNDTKRMAEVQIKKLEHEVNKIKRELKQKQR
jgi:hypothetical protein